MHNQWTASVQVPAQGALDQKGDSPAEKISIEKIFKSLFVVCLILLVGELFWLFVINPGMPLSHIDINKVQGIDRETLLDVSGITHKSSYISVNAKAVESTLLTIPTVETVSVEKYFPDSISIFITQRLPVAVSLALINGKTQALYFDKNGVIFKIGNAGEIPHTLPIISGLSFENIALGAKLPEMLIPFLHDIEKTANSAPELLDAIAEIRINRKVYDSFDLLLYTEHNPVKIKIGDGLTDDTLRYMLLLVDVLAAKGLDVDTIDFRTGTASYTLKGENNG